MQRVFSPWIMAALLFSPALAVAMENHTLSVGYAQTHLSAGGINLFYRHSS